MSEHPPLHAVHEDAGARFTDFGGWSMPVQFEGVKAEHAAVRDAAGKFDVSHMGEVVVSGPDARELMQRLTTNDVRELAVGDAHYSCIVDEDGVLLDDTVVYRRDAATPDATGAEPDDGAEGGVGRGEGEEYLFVPNAGHDAEMTERWQSHRDDWGLDADVLNVTRDRCMYAIQGPDAVGLVEDAFGVSVGGIDRFGWAWRELAGSRAMVARTGYTGEDGVEVILPTDAAEDVWRAIECPPCGLGARDTLRLEMGFLLSGQDFDPEDEPRTPWEAGLGFVVDLDADFVGHAALRGEDARDPEERLAGLVLEDRGVPRHGYPVLVDGDEVGHVTSGTMSPTLGGGIALGYLPSAHAEAGTPVDVAIRGEPKRAKVTPPPFLDRDR